MIVVCATAVAAAQPARAESRPKWSISCDTLGHDQFGDRKARQCTVYVANIDKTLMDDGHTFLMFSSPIIEVSDRGARLRKPLRRRACPLGPMRIAVDGRRVDALSPDKQIDAIAAGQVLIWEEQAEWPHCNMAPYGTMLVGFTEALSEARRRLGTK